MHDDAKHPRALTPNPLRAIRHVDGLHARIVSDKRIHARREKHRAREDW